MGTLEIDRRRTVSVASGTTPRIRVVHQHLWRVFYTKPRAEMAAEKRLRQRGMDVFLPKRSVLRTWSDRKKKVIEPLFRSYIFVHVNELGRLEVLRDDAILTTLRDADGFAQLRPEEIDALRHSQTDPERLGVVDFPLPPVGTPVEVIYGVMAGMKGEVIVHRNHEYIIVRVDSIGQAVKINIPADWVRRVTES
jgi:transcription antitermination factor NusG